MVFGRAYHATALTLTRLCYTVLYCTVLYYTLLKGVTFVTIVAIQATNAFRFQFLYEWITYPNKTVFPLGYVFSIPLPYTVRTNSKEEQISLSVTDGFWESVLLLSITLENRSCSIKITKNIVIMSNCDGARLRTYVIALP